MGKMYQKKISEGYQDKTELMDVHSSYTYKEIEDDSVRELIAFLQQESSMAIKSNYSVSVSEVSPQMITQAEDILNQFSNDPLKDNSLLEQLFALLPRKMKNVADYLLPADADPEQIQNVIDRETDLLRMMETQMQALPSNDSKEKTLLEEWNLSITPVNNEKELWQIKRHMGHSADCFSKAFRVKNSNRDNAFWNYYDKHNYHKEDIHYWYHGSRNMNCLSILHNGLILNPKAPKVGHMFGYGIYLAPKAEKKYWIYLIEWVFLGTWHLRQSLFICYENRVQVTLSCLHMDLGHEIANQIPHFTSRCCFCSCWHIFKE